MMMLVILGISCLAVGTLSGFFGGKYLMMKYVKNNSTINEQMVKMMLASAGQKPTQKKINQIMKSVSKVS